MTQIRGENPMDMALQAKVLRERLPQADVRTDQCDILRANLREPRLMGAIRQTEGGSFEVTVFNLKKSDDFDCILGPPYIRACCETELQAAEFLATQLVIAMRRILAGRPP